ncbi:MAG: hypothetical protein V3G42_12100 [Oscillospiraceae bacterium]
MYFKNHHEVLNARECLQLYRQLVEFGMLENDPENENRILVFRTASEETPEEGFYSENIFDLADELAKNPESQRELWELLENMGYEPEFEEFFHTVS